MNNTRRIKTFIGAMVLTRVMASLLFGVTATDAVTFGAVVMILAAVAFSFTVIPARRPMPAALGPATNCHAQ